MKLPGLPTVYQLAVGVCSRCGSRLPHTWRHAVGQGAASTLCRRCLREQYRSQTR
jgi:ribosomal protein L40E